MKEDIEKGYCEGCKEVTEFMIVGSNLEDPNQPKVKIQCQECSYSFWV